jgi:hypothetical protein
MPTGVRPHTDAVRTDSSGLPTVSVCESRPGTSIFIESENTDGWISTDTVVAVRR